ncbi:MASE3 domain-containing protein [Caldisalinibacter kiritimatiensis]|uniref:Circadian input-output histidine kinase CikA n=1 Tax=Caldisalinibacter kiritimatiensis TaxID=1304284 RepID=R1CRC9_9FIRM|nr:MASE3 domain-containing protein [Caldisalinibacter kiritimatiensis]EOC99268.1 Multi-sensor hybrid histidine kinase [Caldisalinibacter kiritimatiensis]
MNYTFKNKKFLILIVLCVFLIFLCYTNYLLYHTVIELFSVIIAFSLTLIAINTTDICKNNLITYLGLSYGFVALFDLLHLIAYKGMNILSTNSANLATQFWIIGRYMEALSLIIALLLLKKNFPYKKLFSVYSLASLLFSLLILSGFFPDCYIEGTGLTLFKILSEYIIILILVYGIFLLYKANSFDKTIKKHLLISYTLTIVGELSFTLYNDVYGVLNMVGHFFKFFSYCYIYIALVETSLKKPFSTLFIELNKSNELLKTQTSNLNKINKQLKEEIEERQKIEQALRQNKDFIQCILDSLNNSICVIDKNGNIVGVNKSWVQFGNENDKIDKDDIDKNYLEITKIACQNNAPEACEIYNGLKKVLSKKIPYFEYEYPCHSPTEKRWFIMQATPLDMKDGGSVITHINITERKKKEEKLRKLSQAVEQSSSSIVITDLDGNIEYVNPKFTEITGYSYKEAIGQNPRILKSGFQEDSVYKKLWKDISSGKEWHGEFCNVKKNGDIYWEYASISPIKDEDGVITHYIAMKEDITSRKRIEKELRQAQKEAELANKTKSQFLAHMSHEIRTPMNGIIGLTNILLDMQLTDAAKKYLKMIYESANLLLNIINDILDFSKIEAGKMELKTTTFNLKEISEKTISSFKYKAREKNLDLSYQLESGMHLDFKGDIGRIQQVLINLIGNAIKFTEKGSVTLKISEISSSPKRATIKFEVIDTGIGIPKEKQSKLFKSFSRITNNGYNQKGTGLGLAISKKMIELMGGEIGVDSTPGIGSTFYFSIPLQISEQNQDSHFSEETIKDNINTIESNKLTSKKLDILLVEDNEVNRELDLVLLERKGWYVDTAIDGEKAIEKYKNHDYDLILMDIQMPKVDGFEATKIIRGLEKDVNEHIPIIAMTAYAMKEDKEMCLKNGMDDYISKPINAEELYRKIFKNVFVNQDIDITKKEVVNKSKEYIFKLEEALYNTDNNKELLQRLLKIILKNYPNQLTSIKESINTNNSKQLHRNAHGLKGTLSNFTSGIPYQLAYQLEVMGKNNELDKAIEIYKQLEEAMSKFEEVATSIDWDN